jgi:hypothetical protein
MEGKGDGLHDAAARDSAAQASAGSSRMLLRGTSGIRLRGVDGSVEVPLRVNAVDAAAAAAGGGGSPHSSAVATAAAKPVEPGSAADLSMHDAAAFPVLFDNPLYRLRSAKAAERVDGGGGVAPPIVGSRPAPRLSFADRHVRIHRTRTQARGTAIPSTPE